MARCERTHPVGMSLGFNEQEFIKLREGLAGAKVDIARLQEQGKASAEALRLADRILESWKASANEWRQENIDQRNLFPSEDKVQGWFATVNTRLSNLENSKAGLSGAWTVVLFLAPIVTGILVGMIMHLWGK